MGDSRKEGKNTVLPHAKLFPWEMKRSLKAVPECSEERFGRLSASKVQNRVGLPPACSFGNGLGAGAHFSGPHKQQQHTLGLPHA